MNRTALIQDKPMMMGPMTTVAVLAAKQAGALIQNLQGKIKEPAFKGSPKDLVTEADRQSEALIANMIRFHFPDHRILGEESFSSLYGGSLQDWLRAHSHETVWIIDPLDGTTNFVHGLPCYCVSIGIVSEGRFVAGVIYDPSADELYVAEKGKGAYLNGNRIRVTYESKLSHSLVACGLRPSDPIFAFPANMAAMQAAAPKVRNLRIVGSAALHLAYVAAGRLNAFWEVGLHAWDICAGAIIVEEAGGRVTELGGGTFELSSESITATNGAVHGKLMQAFDAAGLSKNLMKRKEGSACSPFPGLSLAL